MFMLLILFFFVYKNNNYFKEIIKAQLFIKLIFLQFYFLSLTIKKNPEYFNDQVSYKKF